MLTLAPTRRLSSVDLPTLGRPTMATAPKRWLEAGSAVDGDVIRLPRGLLLGAAPAGPLPLRADAELGNDTLHLEQLLVRATLRCDHCILRSGQLASLQILLQRRLRILAGSRRIDSFE